MDDLKIEDLLLMLLSQPGKPRDHSSNLDLFKTLFEREARSLNLIFNLTTGFALAILVAIIGTVVESVRSATFDAAFWGTAGIASAAFILIIFMAWRIRRTRVLTGQRYLDLIRLYYYLDAVT